jgi:ubiquinone/menaquinone biosynthesis C-methylase UbiE
MKSTWIVALGVSFGAWAGAPDHPHHPPHRFEDAEAWAQVFDDPARDAWQRPQRVIEFLKLHSGQTVADLGAGTGYFSVRLARAVGATGTVLALDIEPNRIAHIARRAQQAGLSQVVAKLVPPDDPQLAPNSVDLILVVNTWHHLEARSRYLGRLQRALRSGGSLVIVDYREGELPVGPPAAHKLTRRQLIDELTCAGWMLQSELDELEYQYVLRFAPTATPSGEDVCPDR